MKELFFLAFILIVIPFVSSFEVCVNGFGICNPTLPQLNPDIITTTSTSSSTNVSNESGWTHDETLHRVYTTDGLDKVCIGSNAECANPSHKLLVNGGLNVTGMTYLDQVAIFDSVNKRLNMTNHDITNINRLCNATACYTLAELNSTGATGTFNITYNNLLNQNCPNGYVVNGTYSNGTFKCTIMATDFNNSNIAYTNITNIFTSIQYIKSSIGSFIGQLNLNTASGLQSSISFNKPNGDNVNPYQAYIIGQDFGNSGQHNFFFVDYDLTNPLYYITPLYIQGEGGLRGKSIFGKEAIPIDDGVSMFQVNHNASRFVGKMEIGEGTNASFIATTRIKGKAVEDSGSDDYPTLIVEKALGTYGQQADLTQWRDESGNVLSWVDKSGELTYPINTNKGISWGAGGYIRQNGGITISTGGAGNIYFLDTVNFYSDLSPVSSNALDLGTDSQRWKNLYINNISSNVITSNGLNVNGTSILNTTIFLGNISAPNICYSNGSGCIGENATLLHNETIDYLNISGRLGIGTNNLSRKVVINGTGWSTTGGINTGDVLIQGSGQYGPTIGLEATGTGGHLWNFFSTGASGLVGAGAFSIRDDTDQQYRMVIDKDGNFAFGEAITDANLTGAKMTIRNNGNVTIASNTTIYGDHSEIGTCNLNRNGASSLQICKTNAFIRVDGLNSLNYVDIGYSTSAGWPYLSTGSTQFQWLLGGGSSARSFVVSSPASQQVIMSGGRDSSSGNGVSLTLVGGQDAGQYFGGNLNIRAGNSSTNTSRLGFVYFKDAYDNNNFITIDSRTDSTILNATDLNITADTTRFFNNISAPNLCYSNGSNCLSDQNQNETMYNLTVNNNAVINNLTTTNGATIGGNLHVEGNFSAKRPYWNGYYNGTDNFLNTANVQRMNLSNNLDYDAYLISINTSQAIKFALTGDYLCIVSPEFTNTAATAQVAFWMRKNGVDVPWSNSRYSISNGEYLAPAIPFQFDISNPATDYIEFYWYSTSTNSKLESITGLTAPTRPSVPAVILNCQKVSEITD